MKQIIQNYSTGVLELAEVQVPVCSSNKILVRNATSLISIGTERSVIELGRKVFSGRRGRGRILCNMSATKSWNVSDKYIIILLKIK
jgi:hypothetical protein